MSLMYLAIRRQIKPTHGPLPSKEAPGVVFFAVLGIPPVISALDAVRAAIVREHQTKGDP